MFVCLFLNSIRMSKHIEALITIATADNYTLIDSNIYIGLLSQNNSDRKVNPRDRSQIKIPTRSKSSSKD